MTRFTSREELRAVLLPSSLFYFRLFVHYQNGLFWNEGGLLSQPDKYISAMEIIQAELNKLEAEKIKG